METAALMRDEAERVAGMVSWSIDLSTGTVTWSPGMHQVYDVDDFADAGAVETGCCSPGSSPTACTPRTAPA